MPKSVNRRAIVEAVETRQLLSFMPVDATFGQRGSVKLTGQARSVVAMPGGKVIVGTDVETRRYNADGSPDLTYGTRGIAPAMELDHRTGWGLKIDVAGQTGSAKVYTPNGKLLYTFADSAAQRSSKARVDPQGRLVLASLVQTFTSSEIEVRRYATSGQLDATFGTAGTARATINLGAIYVGGGRPSLFIDTDGDVVVSCQTGVEDSADESFVAFDASGSRIAGIGAGGVLSLDSYVSSPYGYWSNSTDYEVQRIDPDGTITLLSQFTSNGETSYSISSSLQRYRAGERIATSGDLAKPTGNQNGSFAGVSIDESGGYVVGINSTQTSFVRFNADLTPDDDWHGFGGADVLAKQSVNAWAIDAGGRVIAAVGRGTVQDDSTYKSLLTAYSPPAGGFGVAAGTAVLLPGGVLDIAGTRGRDRVSISGDAGLVSVRINDRTFEFAYDEVSGIIVHTGAGNDRIDVVLGKTIILEGDPYDWSSFAQVFIQSGTGNDVIRAGSGNDIVETSGGNDYVDARGGSDKVWGAAGDDTVIGNAGQDTLYGGPGDDVLFAANDAAPFAREENTNHLYAGPGRDRLTGSDKAPFSGDEYDALIGTDEDVLTRP